MLPCTQVRATSLCLTHHQRHLSQATTVIEKRHLDVHLGEYTDTLHTVIRWINICNKWSFYGRALRWLVSWLSYQARAGTHSRGSGRMCSSVSLQIQLYSMITIFSKLNHSAYLTTNVANSEQKIDLIPKQLMANLKKKWKRLQKFLCSVLLVVPYWRIIKFSNLS